MQTDLIDSHQFVEICHFWATRKELLLVDLMIERGWLNESDKAHLTYLVQRKIQRDGGDAHHTLATVSDNVKRSLATIEGLDIRQSLTEQIDPESQHVSSTVVAPPSAQDHFELRSIHARGGIGQVWLAQDNYINRSVALKELRPEHEDNSPAKLRFLREARITGQLQHPGIPPIYELGWRSSAQTPYYTMRFVKGPTMAESIGSYHKRRLDGKDTQNELLDLLNAFVTVCNTIAYAHSRGVLHRDIKGQNVVLGNFGEVILLDWGLAKLLDGSDSEIREPSPPSNEVGSNDGLLTVHGQTLGTPAYMAPEQAAGRLEEIDHRTDVYGLGAMLYEILTGQPPFIGTDTKEILKKVKTEAPRLPHKLIPDVPPPLESACMRAIAKDSKDRFDSARELAQTVERWQETQRKAAEDALRASEALYHSLVETLPMNIWRKDAKGQFTFANQGFCKASGRTLEELLGKTDFDVFPKVAAEKYCRDDETVMSTGEPLDATEEHMTGDGEKLYVRVIKLPIHDARGQVVGTQGIFWDVTEIKHVLSKG